MKLPRQRKKARLELAAMLDVIFLVLIFLVYAMLSMTWLKGEIVNLPSSSAASQDTTPGIDLHVLANGELRLEGVAVAFQNLGEALKNFENKPLVRIFADGAISYQELYRILDCLKENGFYKISLQAKDG